MRGPTHLLHRRSLGRALACTASPLLGLLGGLLLSFCSGPLAAQAQLRVPDIQNLAGAPQVEAGVELLRAGRPDAAASLLRSALDTDSTLVSPTHGAAAYWLGKAHERADRPDEAQSTWRTGVRTLWSVGQFDARLADAYLRGLTPDQLRGERLYAVDVYRALLGRVGPDTSEALQSVFRRRVAQVAPLMADSALARVIQGDRTAGPEGWTFRPEAGAALTEWWRGFDPFPATDENERLEEHLTRLVRGRQNFTCAERVSALDDRGLVQLRFGRPYKRQALSYEDGEFFREVHRFGVNVPPSSFPESEIWLYTHIDESGFYLFAEEDTSDCFRQATANELMPGYLTRQRADTDRGLNIAYSAVMAMRAIYQELALYHINFSTRYSKIANYAGWQEMQAMAERSAGGASGSAGQRSTEVGAGVGQTRRVFSNPSLGFDYPTRFVTRMVSRAEREDRQAVERREEAMPRQHTTLLDGAARLPVSVRTARFLDPDGTTRTEVYWGVPAAELSVEQGDSLASSLVNLSATRYDEEHQLSQRKRQRYRVEVEGDADPRMIVPPPLTLEGATDRYHLGLQWGQYQLWPSESSAEKRLGPKRRMATARADSLEPLRAEGASVEASDVKVLTLPDTTAGALANPTEQASPYPFRTLSTDTPLVLSFEVYHLAYGADDRTRYTVAYEAEGETKRGWTRLFRGTDTQRTSTEMTVEGTDRRTQETILLDLSEIERDEPQDVRVTVRVTDEVTGATVSRDVEFVLRPRGTEAP